MILVEFDPHIMFDIGTVWLKINYFGITHREDIRKWWVIVFIAIDVFMAVFVVTNLVVFMVSRPRDTALLTAMAHSPIDYQSLQAARAPVPLTVVSTAALPVGNGRLDLVAQVNNSNANWAVEEVQYVFNVAGKETDARTDFILPGSDKYLTIINATGVSGTSQPAVTFSIQHVVWQRIADVSKLPAANFSIDNAAYSSSAAGNGLPGHHVTATVTNQSYNGFWRTRFVVVLYSGKTIAGVSYVNIDPFRLNEQKPLYSQWDTVAGAVTNVIIVPDINLLDQSNIIRT